jgi:hypothetical protein
MPADESSRPSCASRHQAVINTDAAGLVDGAAADV